MADIVSVKNLVKRYGDSWSRSTTFGLHIAQGEIFGLLGPNGSGKTTAINCMLQLLHLRQGQRSPLRPGHGPRRATTSSAASASFPQQRGRLQGAAPCRENIDYFCSLYEPDTRPSPPAGGRGRRVRGPAGLTAASARRSSPAAWLRRLNIACGIAHQPRAHLLRRAHGGRGPPEQKRHPGRHPAACATRAPRWSTPAITWRRSSRSAPAS